MRQINHATLTLQLEGAHADPHQGEAVRVSCVRLRFGLHDTVQAERAHEASHRLVACFTQRLAKPRTTNEYTRSLFLVGHHEIIDINVPQLFPQF